MYGLPSANRKPPPPTKLTSAGSVSSITSTTEAGAVSAESFESAFTSVPASAVYGARSLDDLVSHAVQVIGDRNAHWEKRVEALKKIRSLLVANAHVQYPAEFAAHLKELPVPFLVVIKDLRSQVVREACITIAHMAKVLRHKLEQFCLYILQELINLIQNAAKVVSSAGTVCVKYVVSYVHTARIIPIIITNLTTHKSKEIRSTLSEVLVLLLEQWPPGSVERQQGAVRDAIRRACVDADPTARVNGRRAYWCYKRQFPDDAEQLFLRLDSAAQKQIEREKSIGSVDALHQHTTEFLHLQSARDHDGRPNVGRKMLPLERRTITSPRSPSASVSDRSPGARSVSAVDAAAAQRARARALYSHMHRANAASAATGSLPRAKRSPVAGAVPPSPERVAGRSRSRPGVSQSQPTSRSSSPGGGPVSLSLVPRRRPSGIPRSLANSRETSPTRTSRSNSLVGSSLRRGVRPSTTGTRTPAASLRLLQQSRDAEHSLRSPEDNSLLDSSRLRDDDSEASSVCSERSLDSFRRHDSWSWCGSNTRVGEVCVSPDDIIELCASTHWTERKDGLTHLAYYLNSGRLLNDDQLKRLTELLNKMFVDAHTKVFSLLLDAVCELLLVHSNQLKDWLYQLQHRLLMKLGTDILGSVQSKIMKTLDVIHECFPAELQLYNIFRFLSDGVAAPTCRTKVAALRFLADLATHYCAPTNLANALHGGANGTAGRAVSRMSVMATDPRTPDLRVAARAALAALYDVNPPPFTALMSELPAETQSIINNVIQQHVRRTSSAGSESPLRSVGGDDVYSRIRKTTSEIRTYTAQTYNAEGNHMSSKDSGISQMSDVTLSNKGHNGVTNGHCNAESSRARSAESSEDAPSTKDSSPVPHHNHDQLDYNSSNMSGARLKPYETDENGYIITRCGLSEREVLERLCELDSSRAAPEQWERLLAATVEVLKYGDCRLPIEYFKNIVRVALAALSTEDNSSEKENMEAANSSICSPGERVSAEAVRVLIWLCRRSETRPLWLDYFDLILLKLVNAYTHTHKDVVRAIDAGMTHIAHALPPTQVLALLRPVVRTRGFPTSLCALKLAAEVAKARPHDITDEAAASLLDGVALLAEHQNSAVRKAAVFCMVAFTLALGEERIKPHLKHLSVSKSRLLQVYISKQRGESTSRPT